MKPLPKLMVAPNGARRSKADHTALPVTDAEVIETAIACHAAGADGIHVHIRDADGKHEIDAGHYRAILDQLGDAVPDMYHQVTSESAERYSGAEQRAIISTHPIFAHRGTWFCYGIGRGSHPRQDPFDPAGSR